MGIREINKKGTGMILLAVFIQIFLLSSYSFSNAYLINQNPTSENSINLPEKNNFIDKIGNFFLGLVSIKQIGSVSAQDFSGESLQCCSKVKTSDGTAFCQDIASSDSGKCLGDLYPMQCEFVSECATGTCIPEDGNACVQSSSRAQCENNGGTWDARALDDVPQCQKGCCVLGDDAKFTTEQNCNILSDSSGFEKDFRKGVNSEIACLNIDEVQTYEKGACVFSDNTCKMTSSDQCKEKFYKGLLCTNPSIDTSCEPTEKTTCLPGEDGVFFIDTCGNPLNVYDSEKIFDGNFDGNDEYWEIIKAPDCQINLDDSDSLESCGNCGRFGSSICSEATSDTENPEYGEYVCEDLRCEYEGETYNSGESWCIYEGKIGNGKDVAGSEQFIAECSNGEVSINSCGSGRSSLCQQQKTIDGGEEFSQASCIPNDANRCLGFNERNDGGGLTSESVSQCQENKHCMIKNTNIAGNFKFDLCVPRYPRGVDTYCSIANQECTVIYKKDAFGNWKCDKNCDCESDEFAQKMSNLCISLGDCGSYVNYAGDGTNNERTKGKDGGDAPGEYSWENYKGNENHVTGQFVQPKEIDEFTSDSSDTDINQFEGDDESVQKEILDIFGGPENLRNNLGAVGTSLSLGTWLTGTSSIFVATGGPGASAVSPGGYSVLGSGTLNVNFATIGTVASFAAIGAVTGALIADSLGIQGPAADTVVLAGGTAGGAFSYYYLSQSTAAWWTGWAAVGIIVYIAVVGVGKTEERKVQFTCLPWEAPTGGDNCNVCNENPDKPCNEYRCESLGQACKLINKDTDNPTCEAIEFEPNAPIITPFDINPDNYNFLNSENKRTEIRKSNGECIQENTPINIKLKTDEFAQCKFSDTRPTGNYEEMNGEYLLEGNLFSKNHTLRYFMPSINSLDAEDVSGDLRELFGNHNLYVVCQDYHGNFNHDEYVMNFCVNSGPDITSVNHKLTEATPENNAILPYETKEMNVELRINEPAECKYDSEQGIKYESMSGEMDCETDVFEFDPLGKYSCTTKLTNLQETNKFYIKCKDKPWVQTQEDINEYGERNTNEDDFEYSLSVSKTELNIDSIYIKHGNSKTNLNFETATEIKGGGGVFFFDLGLQTSGGSNNGVSKCEYNYNGNWIPFRQTQANSHIQKNFNLESGRHTFPIRCTDEAGNVAEKDAVFRLTIDNDAPRIVRAFSSGGRLSLTTNEDAKCYASFDDTKGCGFDINMADVNMTSIFSSEHSSGTSSQKTHYIKCVDFYENENAGCAIKVSPGFFE